MRVVDLLDASRTSLADATQAKRDKVVDQLSQKILDIAGRRPSKELIADALAATRSRRPDGSKVPQRLVAFQALLKEVGLERASEEALRKMLKRAKRR
jgi:hypothetical protein